MINQPTNQPIDVSLFQSYEALIFDMDGTLVDTMPCHARAWEMVGEYLGYPTQGDVLYQLGGASVRTIAKATMEKYGIPMALLEQVIQLKRQFGIELIRQQSQLLPSADVVKHYYGKRPLALGTGSHKAVAEMILQKHQLKPYFNAIVTADDVTKHKPDPDTFLRCADLMGVEPCGCVVFEDADLGVQAGLKAGMHVFDVRICQFVQPS